MLASLVLIDHFDRILRAGRLAMSKLLLNLRNVPDDESGDVRAMLDANGIDYYETNPSLWGLTAGGIWVEDAQRIDEARQLMAQYQAQRRDHARAEQAKARRDGTAETLGMVIRREPGKVFLVLLAIVFLLLLTALPVYLLGR